ncbi:hypothetical protein [Vibrio sp. D431a]|uniref:hypothetical protein n=1 Tax=Vibrio sp. D431a TaxID=2837388 RepID=UPI002553E41D|nr:hypothetical protein [Vibrio sp. D431a]MDK9793232.1 hypothetical protein [Vibrio sp. D431a]
MAKATETNSNDRKTSVPIPFRFKKPDGTDGTTKFTISIDIFNYLVSAFEDNKKEAKKWLVSKAKVYKQKGVDNISSYLREESLCMIIREGLLDGYEIDPTYKVVSSSYYDDEGSIAYIPINMPKAMIYALEKMGEDFQSVIDTKHRYYRNMKLENPEWIQNNLSETVRQDILADMVDEDLISVD